MTTLERDQRSTLAMGIDELTDFMMAKSEPQPARNFSSGQLQIEEHPAGETRCGRAPAAA